MFKFICILIFATIFAVFGLKIALELTITVGIAVLVGLVLFVLLLNLWMVSAYKRAKEKQR